ncbi:glyoxalase [Sphingomonas populi]|uniref:Glyoxalase n=1 Tax=Sphingomonas populi TaxID=2484750 RepID=A0A4Q6XW94_9SPHN|nr:VOC family protein [Sphingomonas populi]RZF61229.1 glyoxalase [Sphingomonas populi]
MALIRPFLPASDFAASKAFYEALGFEIGYQDADLAIFDYEGAGFLLQNLYVKDWAENLMLQLFVRDLDEWWRRTEGLVERFNVQPPRPPRAQQWGLRVGFLFDPAGVLWQASESGKDRDDG